MNDAFLPFDILRSDAAIWLLAAPCVLLAGLWSLRARRRAVGLLADDALGLGAVHHRLLLGGLGERTGGGDAQGGDGGGDRLPELHPGLPLLRRQRASLLCVGDFLDAMLRTRSLAQRYQNEPASTSAVYRRKRPPNRWI